jgi:hypothetical protein
MMKHSLLWLSRCSRSLAQADRPVAIPTAGSHRHDRRRGPPADGNTGPARHDRAGSGCLADGLDLARDIMFDFDGGIRRPR